MTDILLLGEAWGEHEHRISRAFVGASGIELLRMLDEAGIIELTATDLDFIRRFFREMDPALIDCVWNLHPELHRTNVFNLRPPGNDILAILGGKANAISGYPALSKGKFVPTRYIPELNRLADEVVACDPNLIIALGNTPLWSLLGRTGVGKLRGTTALSTHTVEGYKVLATYHPAAVLRQWELRPVTVADFMKAKRESEHAEIIRPRREIWIEPSITDILEFRSRYITGCRILSTDIETAGSSITCIGFAPTSDLSIVIPFVDPRRKGKSYWPDAATEQAVWRIVRDILEDRTIPKLFQNGMYDVAFIWRTTGIKVYNATHDSMLLHHALQPEMLKGLGFMASIYCDEGAWKEMRKGSTTIKRDA